MGISKYIATGLVAAGLLAGANALQKENDSRYQGPLFDQLRTKGYHSFAIETSGVESVTSVPGGKYVTKSVGDGVVEVRGKFYAKGSCEEATVMCATNGLRMFINQLSEPLKKTGQ